jgi:hypothetical protein
MYNIREDSTYIPLQYLLKINQYRMKNNSEDDFNTEIVSSFHNGGASDICGKDLIIKNYELNKFQNCKKRKQITNHED